MTRPKIKTFEFEGVNFKLLSPDQVKFKNKFYEVLYSKFFNEIIDNRCSPHINCDDLALDICDYDYQLGLDEGIKLQSSSTKSSNISREKFK